MSDPVKLTNLKGQEELRLLLVTHYYLQGYRTQTEIAQVIAQNPLHDLGGVSIDTSDYVMSAQVVARCFKKMKEAWRSKFADDFEVVRKRMVAELDSIRRAAWSSFCLSKRERVKTVEKPGGIEITTSQIPEGEAKWLNLLLSCTVKEAEFLGVQDVAPTVEVNITDTLGSLRNATELLSDSQLEALAALEDNMAAAIE